MLNSNPMSDLSLMYNLKNMFDPIPMSNSKHMNDLSPMSDLSLMYNLMSIYITTKLKRLDMILGLTLGLKT